MRHVRLALSLLVALLPSSVRAQSAPTGLTITFLANEGVMLSSGSRKVLIDALFLRYGREYAVPADSTQAALAGARAPFDAVDLVLATHRHGDHFDPRPVSSHLQANPRATFLASQQVIDSLRRFAPARAIPADRTLARTTAPGSHRREVANGVRVQVLGLSHGERHADVEHLGYVVELGGRRVLHVGDTGVIEQDYARIRLDTARIDVALLPSWMVTSEEGRRVIDRWIRPRHVVAIHAGSGWFDRTAREVQEARPGTRTFTHERQTLVVP
jgi:L-ascorbate metabolism protein UlaG (beta-lactamase superfamily)